MTFISGSLTDANPGPALYALMAPALTTAGFTLVDTVVISTRTHKVWKSPAAGNAQNLDWYLDIGYTTTGAGTIALCAFEYFDPATDLGYRGPFRSSSSTIDAATGSRYGATGHALETNWDPNAATAVVQTSLTTAAFGYWISITANRVILLCSTAPSAVMYAGLYTPDPLYAAKAGGGIYPLVTGAVGGTSSAGNLALTRIPPWTVFPGGATWANSTVSCTPAAPPTGQPKLPTDPVTGYPFAANSIQLVPFGGLVGGRWGWLKDVVILATSGVVRGDTATIDGVTNVLSTTNTTYSYAFKAI